MFYLIPFLIFCCHFVYSSAVVGLGAAITDNLIFASDSDLEAEKITKGGWFEVSYERLSNILERHEGKYETVPGGSAINVLKSISGLGVEARAIGRTGNDYVADCFNESLHNRGVKSYLTPGTLPSGQLACFVTSEGQRTFCTYFGASQTDTPRINLNPKVFEGAAHLHIEGYQVTDLPTVYQAIDLAKKNGMSVSIDLSNQFLIKRFRKEVEHILSQVDMIFSNIEEAEELTGLPPEEALDKMSETCSTVVITLSEKGAIAKQNGYKASVPAFDVKVVDTTGAGDGFTGGFLAGYIKGLPLEVCLEQGCYLASFVIQHLGAEISNNQWDAIKSTTVSVLNY